MKLVVTTAHHQLSMPCQTTCKRKVIPAKSYNKTLSYKQTIIIMQHPLNGLNDDYELSDNKCCDRQFISL
jgi:hypothetical protein